MPEWPNSSPMNSPNSAGAKRPGRFTPGRIAIGLVVLATLVAGVFYLANSTKPASDGSPAASASSQVWTCSMHPQVRLPAPGKCPICSMPLVPAKPKAPADPAGGGMLELGDHARAMASVETVPVERRKLVHELRAVGKVQYNERALATVTARVDGYIERLFIDFTGVEVKQGDHLVEIYSPELVVAQQEMLFNPASGTNIADAVKLKLRRWELTDEQIEEVARTRKVKERITLQAPIAGTVIEKLVVQKSAVKAGDPLYKLANLESVWVYLDIYEDQLAWIRYGQEVEVVSEAYPASPFKGRVWFINPVLTDESRTVKVLVNIANEEKKLKPGMFVSARVRATILANGQAGPTGVEGKWTCAMHPQILQPEKGPCPVCKMELTQIAPLKQPLTEEEQLALALPVTAVLDSGARKLVYIERAKGEYVPAEVTLGPRAGTFYPVIAGVKEGDRVAARGSFLLDSQFQIQGLPSLFHSAGQSAPAGHQHGGTAPPPKTPSAAPASAPKPAEHKH
jgi:membrane fusion protein, copper/silver efflux system